MKKTRRYPSRPAPPGNPRLHRCIGICVRGALTFVAFSIHFRGLAVHAGETLYNGIELPSEWPPRLADFPTSVDGDPVVPPYLVSPPKVIPIDPGRQLFVDDF